MPGFVLTRSSRRRPTRTARAALVLFGLAASVLLLELILRVHNPFGFRVKGDRIVLQPYRKFLITNNRFTKLAPMIVHTRNSLGFRGPEPGDDFANDLTIVTVGGSTTECFSLADDKTWTARLADRLRPNFRRLWINNGGLDGQSSFGHLMLLEQHLARLAPKMIVVLVGLNDVAHGAPNPYDTAIERKPARLRVDLMTARSLFVRFANHSEVAASVVNMYRYLEARERRLVTGSQVDLATVPRAPAAAAARLAAIGDALRRTYLGGYRARLESFLETSKRHHIQPVLVTQPALYGDAVDDVTGVDLGSILVNYGLSGSAAWTVLEMYNAETRAVAGARGVPLVDLARSMPKSSRYYFDFVHFTDDGAEKVAELLARDLCPSIAERFPENVITWCSAR